MQYFLNIHMKIYSYVQGQSMTLKIKRILISLVLFILALTYLKAFNIYIMLISYIIISYDILYKALKNIKKGSFLDETFLMSIASIGAFIIGSASEGVAVMLFYQIGETFEHYAVNKSKKSIKSLLSLRSEISHLVTKDTTIDIETKNIKINDILLIKVGERIPVDSIVIEGTSSLDVSHLTGEALLKKINIGSNVLSGSLNNVAPIKVKAVKTLDNSTISKILHLVESANEKKSKNEVFIKKFAKYYTPIVVYTALLLATIPPLFIKDVPYTTWIYRAIMFLVVSCPCALVVSIPLSYFSGIGAIARKGILIKGSVYLEKLAKVNTIIFDKTGTLTKGEFKIKEIITNNIDKNELLFYLFNVEKLSSHPIASSLVKNLEQYSFNTPKNTKIKKELAGLGIVAIVNNHDVLIGNEKLLLNYNIKPITDKIIDTKNTIFYIAIDNEFKGIISIGDSLKPRIKESINQLRTKKINKIFMLSGDNEENAKNIANQLKLDGYRANLLPNEKVIEVEKIMNDNNIVAFIGDGVNDSPSIARSDVGIAMGAYGSDAAIEASDIVIMGDKLSNLSSVINLSRKTMQIVKENTIFAISTKFIVMILGAFGLTNMWFAVFADVGVTILAILNALRLLLIKK